METNGQEISEVGTNTDNLFDAYIAGFFDGEGCVRVMEPKNATGLHVFITNTYLPILQKMKDVYGGNVSLRNKENPLHRTIYQWRISSKGEALKFLERILPYVVEKKAQVLLGIKFCKLPTLYHNRYSKYYPEVIVLKEQRMVIANELKNLKRINYDLSL